MSTTQDIAFYPQLEERDCGATCLRMVAEAYGVTTSMERLRDLTGTDARGTSMAGLAAGAEALGFETLAAELPYDELTAGDLLPAILHWDRDHFVVATEASFTEVHLLDPAYGPRTLSRDEFESHRYGPGKSRAALIIRPGAGLVAGESVSGAANGADPARDDDGDLSIPSVPPVVVACGALLLGTTVFGLGVLRRVLAQAVDLQFREGWLQHLGAMLLATAGVALASYLLRRQTIAYASERGQREVQLIVEHLRVRSREPRRDINAPAYLELLDDSDRLRMWRAYNLSAMLAGAAFVVAGLGYLLSIDVVWGVAMLAALVVIAVVGVQVYRFGRRTRGLAREAQRKQREALHEFAAVLPEVSFIDGGDYLGQRLGERNERAEDAFHRIAAEYSAERQLVRIAMMVALVCLLATGLYRLGYAGLQVADFLMGVVLVFTCLLPLMSVCAGLARWRRTRAGRLRLAELGHPGSAMDKPRIERPRTVTLAWDAPTGEPQSVTFDSTTRLALVGSDRAGIDALLAGMRGRDNVLNARMYFDGDDTETRDLSEYGSFSVVSPESQVASGSLASNIAMLDRPDMKAVEAAAELVGLSTEDAPRGLYTLVGFAGEGIDEATAARTLIARAMYQGVDALVIDGATDVLPAYEEGLLMDEVLNWAHDRLLVVAPLRTSAAYGCDLIVSVEGGEVEARGTHEALLRERGAYFYGVQSAQSEQA